MYVCMYVCMYCIYIYIRCHMATINKNPSHVSIKWIPHIQTGIRHGVGSKYGHVDDFVDFTKMGSMAGMALNGIRNGARACQIWSHN